MSQERLLAVLKDAMSRAEAECPAALRRGEEAFATGMNTWLGVLLPYVSEEDRENADCGDVRHGRRRAEAEELIWHPLNR